MIKVSIYFCMMWRIESYLGHKLLTRRGKHQHAFLLVFAMLRCCAVYEPPVFPPLLKVVWLCCGGKGC